VKKEEFERVVFSTFDDTFRRTFAPRRVGDRRKIHSKKRDFVFVRLLQNRRERRERVDGFFFGAVFEIDIELDGLVRNLREIRLDGGELFIARKRQRGLLDLDIAVVRVELTLEKIAMRARSLDKKTNARSGMRDEKSKFGRDGKNPPFFRVIFERVVQGREHLARDKHAFFVEAIDGNLEDDAIVGHMPHHSRFSQKSQLHFRPFFIYSSAIYLAKNMTQDHTDPQNISQNTESDTASA
jgi:hypothetical protein